MDASVSSHLRGTPSTPIACSLHSAVTLAYFEVCIVFVLFHSSDPDPDRFIASAPHPTQSLHTCTRVQFAFMAKPFGGVVHTKQQAQREHHSNDQGA